MYKGRFWLALPAAAAGAAAALFLIKKASAPAKTGTGPSPAPQQPAVPETVKEASYSFISGFKDAAAVELSFSYDGDSFRYAVIEDGFLAESGDSHVGVLTGEAFSAQFEYGTYYNGEDFAGLRMELSSRHRDLCDAVYGGLAGLKFRDGDNLCLVFPIPDDIYSYLLVTLVKAPDNDDEPEALADCPALRYMLESASFSRG